MGLSAPRLCPWFSYFLVITTQPITGFVDAMPFQVTDLDQESQTIYNTLKTKHITGATVTQVMQSVGQDLVRNVRGKFISVKVSYNFLSSIDAKFRALGTGSLSKLPVPSPP